MVDLVLLCLVFDFRQLHRGRLRVCTDKLKAIRKFSTQREIPNTRPRSFIADAFNPMALPIVDVILASPQSDVKSRKALLASLVDSVNLHWQKELLVIKDEAAAIKDEATAIKDEAAAIKDKAAAIKDEATAIKDEATAIKDEATATKDSAHNKEITAINEINRLNNRLRMALEHYLHTAAILGHRNLAEAVRILIKIKFVRFIFPFNFNLLPTCLFLLLSLALSVCLYGVCLSVCLPVCFS